MLSHGFFYLKLHTLFIIVARFLNTLYFSDMPRKKEDEGKKRKLWCEMQMAKAIAAVREKKMGYLKASKEFKVPRATLFRLANKQEKDSKVAASTNLGRKPIFSKEIEDELQNYLIKMEAMFYGLTKRDVCSLAYQLALRNKIPHPFKNESAGKDWFYGFLKRHPKLSIRKPMGTSFARARGFNKEEVDKFFDLVDDVFKKHNYPANRVFNVDETGLSVVQSKVPHVVGLKGKRQIGSLTSAERGSLVTIVPCMSAGGEFVPPLVIFPRKNMNEQLLKGAPPGTIASCHPSGWIQTNIFTKWFRHFVDVTKPSAESPVLLFLDGHATHKRNIDIINLARANHVTILCLPPHCSHKIQPLDKTFMGPLKSHYSEEVRSFLRHSSRPLSVFDMMELFGRAYLKVQRGDIAVNGFKVTGIYPVNRNVFSSEDFIASTLTVPRSEKPTVDPLPCSSTRSDSPQPCSSKSLDVIVPDKSNPAKFVSPMEISPPPPKKQTSNRGRKPETSSIITYSPYKQELEKALEEKKKLQTRKIKKKDQIKKPHVKKLKLDQRDEPKKLKMRIPTKDDSNDSNDSFHSDVSSVMDFIPNTTEPDDKDAECIFCNGKYSNDQRGEVWIRCVSCSLWAHFDCTGAEKDDYICDFCK